MSFPPAPEASACTLAGLLIGEPDRAPGHLKSAVLLFGRLAMTVLFVTVGISQASSAFLAYAQSGLALKPDAAAWQTPGHSGRFSSLFMLMLQKE